MELIVWEKGVQDIKYLCDRCKKQVQKMTVYGKYAKVRIAERVLE